MIAEIEIAKIKNYSNHGRNRFLIENLKDTTQAIPPVQVKKITGGFYWLKDGANRVTAYLEMNKKLIPARVE